MSNEAVFGKAGTFTFAPRIGQHTDPLTPASLVSFRLYASTPTAAQIADTDNTSPGDAIEAVTTWTDGDDTGEKFIAYSALSDSDPTSTNRYEVYHTVTSYRLEAGADIINDHEPIVVWRAESIGEGFDVHISDLEAVESKIGYFKNEAQIETVIEVADRLIKQMLKADGFDLYKLDQKTAKDFVIYRALSILCSDLSAEPNDTWADKARRHYETLEMLRKSIAIGYDSDGDGVAEPTEKAQGGYAYIGI